MAKLRITWAEAVKLLHKAEVELAGLQSGLEFEQTSERAVLINEETVIAEDIKHVRNQLDRTRIKAPVSDVVNDLRFHNPTSVIGPGASVL